MLALAQAPLEKPELRYGGRRISTNRLPDSIPLDARRLDHSLAARRAPRIALMMRDRSFSGLSASSDVPLFPGETLSVNLPAEAGSAWPTRVRVRRCEPSAAGYRVTLDFEPLPAA